MKKKLCKVITKKGKICKKYCNKDSNTCCVHKEKEICIICFDNLKITKKLHCSHKYCKCCINKWICIEQKTTCPICRTIVLYPEENDAFDFCINNKLLTTIVYYEFNISDEELIEYIQTIMICDNDSDLLKNPHCIDLNNIFSLRIENVIDQNVYIETSAINSYYDHVEWNSFINYLKLKPELFESFNNSPCYAYYYYQKFDEHNQGIIRNGKSFIVNYKINII